MEKFGYSKNKNGYSCSLNDLDVNVYNDVKKKFQFFGVI
jgi:hypothetical protein